MSIFFRLKLFLIVVFWMAVIVPSARSEPQTLKLLGRSSVGQYGISLSTADLEWLKEKKRLVLGTSGPDYPPFDISSSRVDYEGYTADVSALLSEILKLPIEVRRYDSRANVIEALRSGEVDLLGSSNDYEGADMALALSEPYADDQPVLATRNDDTKQVNSDLSGKRIAMLNHYLPENTVLKYYPRASLQLYSSVLDALGAVAFGQADVFLGDTTSASYLINNNYMNNVRLVELASIKSSSFSFALRRDNHRLMHVVNSALSMIPVGEHTNIIRRWGAGDIRVVLNRSLILNHVERRWVEQHPRLKVAFNSTSMPVAFINRNGEFRGMSAEILAKVSFRTGLKFEAVQGASDDQLIDMIKTGKADVLAAFMPAPERQKGLSLSRPYFMNPFVMITRNMEGEANVIGDMSGKKLAIQKSNPLKQFLADKYPSTILVEVEDVFDSLAMLADKKVDAAVGSLVNAQYLIANYYRNQLKVTSTIGLFPASFSLATALDASPLDSILEKGLLSITPQEMEKITSRWRNEFLVQDSYWGRYKGAIIKGLVSVVLLLLFATFWIAHLRRIMNKRINAEKALFDQLSFTNVMLDGTPHPIYVRDKDGRLLNCNSSYLDTLGAKKEEVLGETITASKFAAPEESLEYDMEYAELIAEGRPIIRDRRVLMADGRRLTIYHWMLPYRDSEGAVIGMIGGWIDVSERQHLLNELNKAKAAADEANRAKSTFLATMSHEIRTPLNAVIGMLELAMKKTEHGEFDFSAVNVASSSAKGLMELIGDILDISRIETGKLTLNPECTNLRRAVESVARVFDGLAKQKGLQLRVRLDADADIKLIMDPVRFKQIISNLLSNAIKFTEQGDVRLGVDVVTAARPEHLAVRIFVEDAGIGISVEDQRDLFQPFVQAGNCAYSPRGGSGLGLVIIKSLCEKMGGTLHLSSALGVGTQVELLLEFPIASPEVDSFTQAIEAPLETPSLTVLVVDDCSVNRLLLTKQLTYLGHTVFEAENGEAALPIWREEAIDVLITDCSMPIMNGYALATAIRNEERAKEVLPCRIYGFTANAQVEEIDRCKNAGMDDCLFKPLSLVTLQTRLTSIPVTSQTTEISTKATSNEPFDLTELMFIVGGDQMMLKLLLSDLANSVQSDLEGLKSLSEVNDLSAMADLAHRVKGGARVIKNDKLIVACEDLERLCAGSGNLDSIGLVLAKLVKTMSALISEIQKRISAPPH